MWAELTRMRNFKDGEGPQSFFGPESTESLNFCNEDFSRGVCKAFEEHGQGEAPALPERSGRAFQKKDVSAKSYHREETATYMKWGCVPRSRNRI